MLAAIIIGAGAYLGLIRYAWRTQRGRALNRHPYLNPYDDAPGARSQTGR
jgi:hypothetical protein